MNNFASIFSGKKIFITGHTGFKGAWLCEWFMMMGARVVGYSLEPPSTPSLYEQLDIKNRIAKDYREDIRNLEKITSVLAEEKPDFIFHMAAQTLVGVGYDDPIETFSSNVMGTVNVLDAIRRMDHSCVSIMITTDKVYENMEWMHSYREEDRLGGYDPYSASKGCDEIVISSYKRSYLDATIGQAVSKPTASVRAGNVIGGGDWADNRIVPDCMRSLRENIQIPVRNKTSTRPWQHVLEPLSGYVTLAALISEAEQANNRDRVAELCSPFNFGPNIVSNKTVKDLVEEITKYWPGKWEDKSDPNAPHEAGKLNLSSDKAFHLLNWLPRWAFSETIEKTVTWYKEAVGFSSSEQYSELTQRQIKEYENS